MNSHQRRKFRRELKRSQKAPLLIKNNNTRFIREEWTWDEEVNGEFKQLIFPNVSNDFIDKGWSWSEEVK